MFVVLIAFQAVDTHSGHSRSQDSDGSSLRNHGVFAPRGVSSKDRRTPLLGEEILKITTSLMRMFPALVYTPTVLLKYLATPPSEAIHVRSPPMSTAQRILRFVAAILLLLVGVVWSIVQEVIVRIVHSLAYILLLLAAKANLPTLIGRVPVCFSPFCPEVWSEVWFFAV